MASKIKIGYSHTLLYREQAYQQKLDGIGIYTKCLYREIEKKWGKVYPIDFSRAKQFFKRGTQQPASFFSNLLPKFISLHPSLEKQLDLFHATDYLIPRLKNVPVVATLHDAIMLKNPELASNLRGIKNFILKRSATWADHVITISDAMIEDIVNYWHIKPENISVVANGIDDIWQQPIPDITIKQVLKKYAITKPFILSAGTIQPRKNYSRLIQAYRNLPQYLKNDFQLIIVGKKGWDCDDIISDLQSLSTKNEGEWLNYVEFTDLRALYQAATVFAFPSLAEGFGLPILESFASKTPVLAANTSSIPEIAADAALLVNPNDTSAITDGLKLLLSDESLQYNLITKGQERVKNYSWDRCAEQTYQVFQKLC